MSGNWVILMLAWAGGWVFASFIFAHNHMKYLFFKNHLKNDLPFVDAETQGDGGEGVFPKVVQRV